MCQYDDVLTMLTTFRRKDVDREQLTTAMMARHSSSSVEDALQANLVRISNTDTHSDVGVDDEQPTHCVENVDNESQHVTLGSTSGVAFEQEDVLEDGELLSFDTSGDIEFDPDNPSSVLMRYVEIASAYSEVLQLEVCI